MRNTSVQLISKTPFLAASYLAQVRRLRRLAKDALERYALKIVRLQFIQHGENATFKATDARGNAYLVRIHRGGYHTKEAINEELKWLAQLAHDPKLKVPGPIRSKNKLSLEDVRNDDFPEGRAVCVFRWIDGQHIRQSLRLARMTELGQLTARLHATQPQRPVRYRRYWTAQGLVGVVAKVGSVEHVAGRSPMQQKRLSQGRRRCEKALAKFQKAHPERLGLIHADLHFGNLLVSDGELAPIDFDDCGFGFYAYDLAVAIISMETRLGEKRKKEVPAFRRALIEGYSKNAKWGAQDEAILQHLLIARELVGIGWLNSRSDNPRLKKYLKPVVQRGLKRIKKEYGI